MMRFVLSFGILNKNHQLEEGSILFDDLDCVETVFHCLLKNPHVDYLELFADEVRDEV